MINLTQLQVRLALQEAIAQLEHFMELNSSVLKALTLILQEQLKLQIALSAQLEPMVIFLGKHRQHAAAY